jgi:hypothetical protein
MESVHWGEGKGRSGKSAKMYGQKIREILNSIRRLLCVQPRLLESWKATSKYLIIMKNLNNFSNRGFWPLCANAGTHHSGSVIFWFGSADPNH